MSRAVRSVVWFVGLGMSIVGTSAGCAHFIENRAITAFAQSLKDHDLDGLKEVTSDDFKERALRTATALEDLKILRLPDGKTSVVSVEELSKDKKRVTVQVGEDKEKKEVWYELTREETGRWVVDDIYLKQKKKGIEAYKSVTEQMDLLLTVRELLDAWNDGDRNQVLAVTTPKFRLALEELPPSFLAHLTKQVTQGKAVGKKDFKPTASLDEKVAVVKLPRLAGDTVITLELRKGRWQVADIAIASKDEEEKLPSALNLARAVNRCVAFLSAYQSDDKKKLAELCSVEFFGGSLSFADLTQAKLPEPQLSDHELQVRLRGSRADFTLRSEKEFVQIDMQRRTDDSNEEVPEFVVSDVTIYEIATKQEIRLSAMFTAQGMLEVFIDALSRRELDSIKHCSTRDFTNRVWSKISDGTVAVMPLDVFDSTEVEFKNASFMGALTKMEVIQGGVPLTYLLRDEGGRFMVDDVEWQLSGLPKSVKSTLEVYIPIQDFASGITLGRDPDQQQQALDLIRGNSTNEFNRAVWSVSKFVPNSGMSADTFLTQASLKSMAITDKEIVVHFGDQRYGAKVTMRHEHERFIVDDVLLIAGVEDSQRLALKHTLRNQLARNEAKGPKTIEQVNHVAAPDRRVQQANHEVSVESEKPVNAAVNPPRELPPDEPDPFTDDPL